MAGFPDRNAETAYYVTLGGYENQGRAALDAFRVAVSAWEESARAAGVTETNVIAVLQSANLWDQATADLVDIAIPTEIKRVQNGGTPLSSLSGFAPTPPPTLPDIADVLASQGGAVSGTARYTGGTVTITPPPVTLAPVVVAEPTAATTSLAGNVSPAVAAGAGFYSQNPTDGGIDAAVPPSPQVSTSLDTGAPTSLSMTGSMGDLTAPAPAPSPAAALPWLWLVVAAIVALAVFMLLRRGG